MAHNTSEIEKLKIIYHEIVNGYSISSKGFYVRHLTELDHIEVLRKRISAFNKYVVDGIPSEAEQIKNLIEREEWTQAQEEKILELKYIIIDNEKNVNLIKEQQHIVRAIIQQKRKELGMLMVERQELLGLTADRESERDAYNYLIFISLYKNAKCIDRLFGNFDDFMNIEPAELESYETEMEQLLHSFKEESIKKVAVLPFFLNPFSYSKDRVDSFLHKPVSELTHYQMLLFSLGTRNLNILNQAEGEPPDLMDDINPQLIVDWYDQKYSIILGKRNTQK